MPTATTWGVLCSSVLYAIDWGHICAHTTARVHWLPAARLRTCTVGVSLLMLILTERPSSRSA